MVCGQEGGHAYPQRVACHVIGRTSCNTHPTSNVNGYHKGSCLHTTCIQRERDNMSIECTHINTYNNSTQRASQHINRMHTCKYLQQQYIHSKMMTSFFLAPDYMNRNMHACIYSYYIITYTHIYTHTMYKIHESENLNHRFSPHSQSSLASQLSNLKRSNTRTSFQNIDVITIPSYCSCWNNCNASIPCPWSTFLATF